MCQKIFPNILIFFSRQELNSLKSAHVNSQKYLSEHESQRKHLEARLQHEMEGHQRYVQTLQGQIQYHSSRAQGLQHSLDSLSAQQQVKIVVCTSDDRLWGVVVMAHSGLWKTEKVKIREIE